MVTLHDAESMLTAPLEAVVGRWFPVDFLQWLHEVSLRALAEAHPTRLRPPGPRDAFGRDRKLKRPYLAELLLVVLEDRELGRAFFDRLPPPTRAVLGVLGWSANLKLAELEKAVGFPIADPNTQDQRQLYRPFLLRLEHGFAVIHAGPNRHWVYYSGGRDVFSKADYYVALPTSLRSCLRAWLPVPPGYELEPLAELPASAAGRFDCGSRGVADLRLVTGFLEQGLLKRTRTDRVTLPSARTIRGRLDGPEFFPDSVDADLAVLRTRLLAGVAVGLDPRQRLEILAEDTQPDPLRALLRRRLTSPTLLHTELLGHVRQSRNSWLEYDPAAIRRIEAFFAGLPSGQWIPWANIHRYHVLREEHVSPFTPKSGTVYVSVARRDDVWFRGMHVGRDDLFTYVGEPLLKGFAFLLAALGLAEISYDLPPPAPVHLLERPYLSPFDGLRHVRLTPLGEFVFGRRDTCEIDARSSPRSVVLLDDVRLVATCRSPDALTTAALERLFERVGSGRYLLTAKSLLSGCATRADLEKRIQIFRRSVADRPPPNWEAFFARTLSRVDPLTPEPDFAVFKVGEDEELRRLLASDPVLREIVLKMEGLRIAVRYGDVRKLTRRLEQLGYLRSFHH